MPLGERLAILRHRPRPPAARLVRTRQLLLSSTWAMSTTEVGPTIALDIARAILTADEAFQPTEKG